MHCTDCVVLGVPGSPCLPASPSYSVGDFCRTLSSPRLLCLWGHICTQGVSPWYKSIKWDQNIQTTSLHFLIQLVELNTWNPNKRTSEGAQKVCACCRQLDNQVSNSLNHLNAPLPRKIHRGTVLFSVTPWQVFVLPTGWKCFPFHPVWHRPFWSVLLISDLTDALLSALCSVWWDGNTLLRFILQKSMAWIPG